MEPQNISADIEIRFDSFTLRDLPESEQETLRKMFNESPIVSTTHINPQPRDKEFDEQFFRAYGRPRPKGGLHGGLGEGVYIYIVGASLIASRKAIEKIVEELTKRAFEWLDRRFDRRKEIGLAEVTIYGPDGKQLNRQAIVYDGRERRRER
jgi:hypothetical protein